MKATDPKLAPIRRELLNLWTEATGYTADGRPAHELQLALHADEHRHRVLVKGRRGGGTTSGAREVEVEMMMWNATADYEDIALFAPTSDLTGRLLDMNWTRLLRQKGWPRRWIAYPRLVRGEPPKTNPRLETIWGTRLWAYSLDGEMPGEGLGLRFAVSDEAGHKNFNEKTFWSSIFPTLLDRGGRSLTIGAAKQAGKFFRDLAVKQTSNDPTFSVHKFGSAANPANSAEDLAQMKASMPDWLYRQEAECEFVDLGDQPWTAEEIWAIVDDDMPQQRPYDPSLFFVDGWDLAKSIDHTVGITLEASGTCPRCQEKGHVLGGDGSLGVYVPCPDCGGKGKLPHQLYAYERFQHAPWPVVEARMLARHNQFQSTVIFDATGVGGVTSDHLDVPSNALWRKAEGAPPGFIFTPNSKTMMIVNLQRMIQHREIRIPNIGQLVRELLDYRWDDEQIVTDSVMALALACWALASRRAVTIEWL